MTSAPCPAVPKTATAYHRSRVTGDNRFLTKKAYWTFPRFTKTFIPFQNINFYAAKLFLFRNQETDCRLAC